MSAALQEEVSALQRTSCKEQTFNTARTQRLVVRTDRRLRITLWRPQWLAQWKEWLAHGESLAGGRAAQRRAHKIRNSGLTA